MTARVAEGAAELLQLMERFSALSECGIRACEAGDELALAAALDARDLLTPRFAVLARELAGARHMVQGHGVRERMDLLLAPVLRKADEARALNTSLAARAQVVRTAVGEQLGRLAHEETAHARYAAATGHDDGQRLDLTR